MAAIRALISARCAPATVKRRLLVLSRLALAGGMLIPLVGLLPELLYLSPDLNDDAFHLGLTRNTIAAIQGGANPLDFWVPTWVCGYPLFHYYQPGPYLLLAGLHALFFGAVPLFVLFRCLQLLALTLFPLANYVALRWLRQPRETAGWAAFLSCLIAAHGTYGIELESFTRTGWGLWAQAIALPLLPLALAGGWRAVTEGGRTLKYAGLLAAACLTHILYGYIAVLSLGLAPLMVPGVRRMARRGARLGRLSVQLFALIAFFVVPLAWDLAYHSKSLFDEAAKFDSHGAGVILSWLFGGVLLDSQRLPVLTCLAAAGAYLSARRWLLRGSAVHGWLLCGFIFWTLLYFGRPTWGALIDLLPLSGGLHLERLSNGVHIFALWLAAVALGRLSRWCVGIKSLLARGTATVLCLALLAPVVVERATYLTHSAQTAALSKQLFEQQVGDLEPALHVLRAAQGRVYAGHSGNWGRSYMVGHVPLFYFLTGEAITQIANAPFSWSLPTEAQFLLQWPTPADYNLYDIRYLLTDQTQPPPVGAQFLSHFGRNWLYRLPSEGPFGLVAVPLAIAGDKDTLKYMNLNWVKSSWPGAHAHARLVFGGEDAGSLPLLRMTDAFHYTTGGASPAARADARGTFDPPGVFAQPPPRAPRGQLRDMTVSQQSAGATVVLQEPGVVLFKTTYHPAWRAFVDGAPVPTMQLSPGMIGVQLPAGFHSLQLFYQPGWSKAIMLLAGLVLALAMDWWLPKGKRTADERRPTRHHESTNVRNHESGR